MEWFSLRLGNPPLRLKSLLLSRNEIKRKRLVKAVSTAARDVDMIALVDTFLVSTR